MAKQKLTDREAKDILLRWPQVTAAIWEAPQSQGAWLRAHPKNGKHRGPYIVSPGADLFKTQPDGLYVYFNGVDSADVVIIESCGSVQNLNDKRSRYIPTSHSTLLSCSNNWFDETINTPGGGKKPRWEACGSLSECPTHDIKVPIRHLRVLFALPNDIYKEWCPNHIPAGYEFFCPHSSLDSYTAPKMQRFLSRMSIASQFYLQR